MDDGDVIDFVQLPDLKKNCSESSHIIKFKKKMGKGMVNFIMFRLDFHLMHNILIGYSVTGLFSMRK